MNIKILIGVIIIVVISIIFILIRLFNPDEKPIKKNPKEIEITYRKSAGIPYKTVYEIEDETIVKLVRTYVLKDENKDGRTGGAVYTNYVFEGLKEGSTTITFKLVHLDGMDSFNEEKTTVKVDKEGNISKVEVLGEK